MITNERQYRIAKAQLKKFDEARAVQRKRGPSADVDPRIHTAMGDALKSEADELRRQLREYERLREGRVKYRKVRSLTELPRVLIEARIASRSTQKTLATRLGVAEQQVQRWEATEYAGVSVERLQQVADALGAEISEQVSFAPASGVSRKSKRSTRRTGKRRKAGGRTGAATVSARSGKSGRSSSKKSSGGRGTRSARPAREATR
jgi:transcriptional regulator with XRE-family HTH domain